MVGSPVAWAGAALRMDDMLPEGRWASNMKQMNPSLLPKCFYKDKACLHLACQYKARG
jgi:hypothetical protein